KKDEEIAVTIVLRRQTELGEELLSGRAPRMARSEAEQAISANPGDLAAVAEYAKQHGLKIAHEDTAARRLLIEGTIEQIEAAFGVCMGWVTDANDRRYLSYQGAVSLPKPLTGIVTAVLGLDRRPVARHGAAAD
ncbi:MAG: protease pro-enzyme activation domain-containing protein, partial [Bryobacteraceae bacterium]